MTVHWRHLLETWAEGGYPAVCRLTSLPRGDARRLVRDTLRLAGYHVRTDREYEAAKESIRNQRREADELL